jgi:anti-sigma-K factor RskA
MNVTEYIASGILESYALGAVSEQERREVDCLSGIYPELRQELDRLSESLEGYALLHSQEPPADLKARIMAQLDFGPAELERPMITRADSDAVVRPLNSRPEANSTYRFTWLVAASVGLAVLVFSGYLFTQLSQTRQMANALNASNIQLNDEVNQLRKSQTRDQQTVALLTAPGTRSVRVAGNEKAPNGELTVYWNAAQQKVAVAVRSLPALPTNKQYQLWALVDGKPVDAGVFDPTTGVQPLNRAVARAQAFAVTVEQRGGSTIPTMPTLLALGAVG